MSLPIPSMTLTGVVTDIPDAARTHLRHTDRRMPSPAGGRHSRALHRKRLAHQTSSPPKPPGRNDMKHTS
jgi:hypothetical protein